MLCFDLMEESGCVQAVIFGDMRREYTGERHFDRSDVQLLCE